MVPKSKTKKTTKKAKRASALQRSNSSISAVDGDGRTNQDELAISDSEERVADGLPSLCPHAKVDVRITRLKKQLPSTIKKGLHCSDCKKDDQREKSRSKILESGTEESGAAALPLSLAKSEDPSSVWLCLRCGVLSCGRADKGHAVAHFEQEGHHIAIDVGTLECWCYGCDKEAVGDPKRNQVILEARAMVEGLVKPLRATKETSKTTVVAKKSNRKISAPGLNNLGNTCFFNSVMQCISYTRALTQRKELLTAPSSQRSTLTDALLSFLNSMAAQQSVGGGTVNPKPIFSVLSNEWRMYKRMGQQDSHELLRRLLDGVREELMDKSLPKTPSNRVTVIDRIFGGQLCQVIVCDSCKHISYAFEDFLDLSLPIKDEAKESWGLSLLFGRSRKTSAQNSPSSSPVPSPEPDVNRDQLVAIKSTYANDPENLALIDILLAGGSPITVESDPTLQRCLTKFMAVETLQGDAVYSCDSCFKIKYGVTPAEHAKGLKENSQYAPDSRATTPLASEDDQDTESSEMADSQPVGQDTLASQSVTPQSVDHISDPESSPGLDAEDSANDEPADVSKVTHELPFLTIETSEGRKGVLPSDNEDNDSGVLSRRNPRGSNSRPLVQSRAYKRYLIHRTPETLVLHLKRFQQVGFGGRTKKVEDVVAFDEFVDITPFLAPRGAEKAVESDPAVGRTPLLNDRTREAKYRLYGVVVHQGGLFSGHYIAYARVQSPEQRVTVPEEGGDGEESEWTYFSDSSVRPSSWAEVKKAQAYLLFYERWPQSSDPSAA